MRRVQHTVVALQLPQVNGEAQAKNARDESQGVLPIEWLWIDYKADADAQYLPSTPPTTPAEY